MIQRNDTHPLTDFTRKASDYIQRLKDTGNPEMLTVNGEVAIVVQSAEAYQKLLDAAELRRRCQFCKRVWPRQSEAKVAQPGLS